MRAQIIHSRHLTLQIQDHNAWISTIRGEHVQAIATNKSVEAFTEELRGIDAELAGKFTQCWNGEAVGGIILASFRFILSEENGSIVRIRGNFSTNIFGPQAELMDDNPQRLVTLARLQAGEKVFWKKVRQQYLQSMRVVKDELANFANMTSDIDANFAYFIEDEVAEIFRLEDSFT